MKDRFKGKKIVSICCNLPGPLITYRLKKLMAMVIKVEPPEGDPLEKYCPQFYHYLSQDQVIQKIDLKNNRNLLLTELEKADLFIVSNRPQSLKKLGLDFESLHKLFPSLNYLSLVGFTSPHHNKPGHDLTYLAKKNILSTKELPKILLADTAGALEGLLWSQAALLNKNKSGEFEQVSLDQSVDFFTLPLKFGLTGNENALLGGALPGYNIYPTKEGFLALGALEPHFFKRLVELMGLNEKSSKSEFEKYFLQKSAREWESWGQMHDLPMVEISEELV